MDHGGAKLRLPTTAREMSCMYLHIWNVSGPSILREQWREEAGREEMPHFPNEYNPEIFPENF